MKYFSPFSTLIRNVQEILSSDFHFGHLAPYGLGLFTLMSLAKTKVKGFILCPCVTVCKIVRCLRDFAENVLMILSFTVLPSNLNVCLIAIFR